MAQPKLNSARILLVDDDQISRQIVLTQFSQSGVCIQVAQDGQTAIEMALQAQEADQPFDLVLMDVVMPEMSGLEATLALRDKGYRGPVVAFTVFPHADRCLEAGCNDYFGKPYRFDSLLQTVKKHLSARAKSS